MPCFKDHFSDNSAQYAACRPTYPTHLVDYLAAICPGRALAWDCACGTGQLSVLLADKFEQIIATDASSSQVDNAKPHPRVRYQVAPAEASGLSDKSVDLITVAQAAHWFHLDSFYTEVRRVARPNAVIALAAYAVFHVDREIDAVIEEFYNGSIGPYWPPERQLVDDNYRSLDFPFSETVPPEFHITVSWDLAAVIGYLNTWSAVRRAEKALGHSPLVELEPKLLKAWGDPGFEKQIRWPLSLRVGKINAQSP